MSVYTKPTRMKKATAMAGAVIGISHGGQAQWHWHGVCREIADFVRGLKPKHLETVPGDCPGSWLTYWLVPISDKLTLSVMRTACKEIGIRHGPYMGHDHAGYYSRILPLAGGGEGIAIKPMQKPAALKRAKYDALKKDIDLAHILAVVFDGDHRQLPTWSLAERLRCFCCCEGIGKLPDNFDENKEAWIAALVQWESKPSCLPLQLDYWLQSELDSAAREERWQEYNEWFERQKRLQQLFPGESARVGDYITPFAPEYGPFVEREINIGRGRKPRKPGMNHAEYVGAMSTIDIAQHLLDAWYADYLAQQRWEENYSLEYQLS